MGANKSVIKRIKRFGLMFLPVFIILFALVVLVPIAVLVLNSSEIHGQKLEEGLQVAYGTITGFHTIHGGDWHMHLDSSTYIFEFPYGTFVADNHPHIGDNIAIAYEWRLLWYHECVDSAGDGYDSWQYWAPLVLDWELLWCYDSFEANENECDWEVL